jgi:hypothetical protein
MHEDHRKIVRARLGSVEILGTLMLLFTVFPYIQIISFGSYTQPYALILAAVIFSLNTHLLKHVNFTDRTALLGLAFFGFSIYLLTCFPYSSEQEYKYLLNYISPIIITVASIRFLLLHHDASKKILQFAIVVWLGVAVAQKFINPTFALELIGHWGEHSLDILESGRGVLSLAPEPTHHAFHILILAACLIQLDRSRFSRILILLCIFDVIFLAASSSALLALGMASLTFLLFYQLRWLTFVLVLVIVGWCNHDTIHLFLPNDNRLFMLVSEVLVEPSSLLNIDYSVNIRLGGVIATLAAITTNFFIPHGMSILSWEAIREDLLQGFPWLMDLSYNGPPSGIGILFFQIGLLALPFFVRVFYRILNINVSGTERIILLSIPFVFLGQYSISAPSFSLLYACALVRFYHFRLHRSKTGVNVPPYNK